MNQATSKRRKPHVNVFAASTWPHDAAIWMDVAVRLDRESGRAQKSGPSNHFKLNVAHVCTGLAFELAYKSLLVAEFKLPKKTHSIKKLHKMLAPATRERVEQWFKEVGWDKSDRLLEYLDEEMSNPDRKYWMENPWKRAKTGMGTGTGFVIGIEMMTIPKLAPILYKLANLGAQNLDVARKQNDLIGRIQLAKSSDPDADVSTLEAQLNEHGYEFYRSLSDE